MSLHSSKACCETPTAAYLDYSPKGSFQTLGNFRTYVVGPKDAKKAVYFIYDIFGFQQPTLQGADIIAEQGYLVLMPDLFDGKYAQHEWMARDTEEKKQALSNFLAGLADPAPHLENVHKELDAFKKAFPTVERWGSIGYCWGGKIVALTSGQDTPWSVGIQTSPARVDADDARNTVIPMAMLASNGEPADAVKAYELALNVPKHVETFSTQIHGWMSARADLADPAVKKEYERGYQIVLNFLGEHL